MKKFKVKIRTITPLWTGDLEGKSEKLKLTGIIGSLRWWFEALVRGMGYYACDITSEKSDEKCKIDIKKPEDVLTIYEKICPVCFLFGTTGWKSRFSLTVDEDRLGQPFEGKINVRLSKDKKHKGWHYEAGLMGNATLVFQYDEFYLKEDLKFSEVLPSIIKILLYLIQEYGMLGAKTSMGYGVVRFKTDGSELSIKEGDWKNFTNFLALFDNKFNPDQIDDNDRKRKIKNNLKNLPNLKDMFFIKLKINDNFDNILENIKSFYRLQDGIVEDDIDKWKDSGWLITSPVVRNCLRCIFRGKHSDKECKFLRSCTRNYWWDKRNNQPNKNYNGDKTIDVLSLPENKTRNIRHFLTGSTQEPEFSVIQVSHVYTTNKNLEFRIYGWLPDKQPLKDKVQNILNLLSQLFNDVPWREKLPSQIQQGICWQGRNLKLLHSCENIQRLFSQEGENQ
ncbi:type III-B CRISPR module RAMP protein Cmr1 [Thermodesulfatator atlanticus]|uniref:type III-B CRISPR module RAMP protein Cmr1 n=1 Tax=Thermodesulfatator atlanticus TaxID=501497 RepID=UPI0003B3279F|nr:type III-B CRISPR module RAMP protein Cmr1 [Thermodesulfatator atlanticus]